MLFFGLVQSLGCIFETQQKRWLVVYEMCSGVPTSQKGFPLQETWLLPEGIDGGEVLPSDFHCNIVILDSLCQAISLIMVLI